MTYEEIARRNKRLFAILETHPNHQQAKYELEQNLERLSLYLTRARHRATPVNLVRMPLEPGTSYHVRKVVDKETGKVYDSVAEAAEALGIGTDEAHNNLDKGRFYK